ncbi:glycoside hydrolase family 16 protein [Nocardioides nitrophenolicus]|uniref:glycoside hydrolase family 16 protein n=1 Tax=Nocardioides nitrophenolicus TaxID=60489 RepID=UPI001958C0BD|nr:glycoside hydrolase family 16 protein [Nocardioides nitrophenolicus]MBM7520295.1 beta-glucanase (GH16 family) [Nocardioides nitrophenolicus]
MTWLTPGPTWEGLRPMPAAPRRRRVWLGLALVAALATALVVVRLDEAAVRGEGADAGGADAPAAPTRPSGVPTPSGPLTLTDLRQVPAASRGCLLGRPRSVISPDLPASSAKWRSDLTEDFDRLRPRIWRTRDQTLLNHDSAYLLERNVTTRNGRLAITARQESAGGRSYTSGYVDTDGRYALPTTFQVAIRAKTPSRQGLWAAPLWLRPTDRSGGEIDLVETTRRPGEPPRVSQSIHTAYGDDHQVSARRFDLADLGDRTGTAWHDYVIRKTPGLIVMWIDGRVTSAFCAGSPSWYEEYYDAGKRWSLRVNLQVGGWGGQPRPGDDWSGQRATMLVDSLRTWVRKGA